MGLETAIENITVISFAEQFPGPFATRLLADLGAEVIMVERPGGDPSRQFPSVFNSLNYGKRSLAVNLKHPMGREIISKLIKTSHVVIEGFRPGVAQRLGIDYQSLSSLNQDLIYVSISGFGQEGPYRERPVHDLTLQGIAGALMNDQCVPLPWGDVTSALFATVAVLGALLQVPRSGGCYIDLSMLDTLIAALAPQVVGVMQDLGVPNFLDEPAYGVFQTNDGKRFTLSIAHEDSFWNDLCESLGLPQWSHWTALTRKNRRGEIRSMLTERFKQYSWDQVVGLFATREIPYGPVNRFQEVAEDPQVVYRDTVHRFPGHGWMVRSPLLSPRQSVLHGGVPTVGEHNRMILAALHYDENFIATLVEQGVLFSVGTDMK